MLEENFEMFRKCFLRSRFKQRPVEIQKMLCESALTRTRLSFKNESFAVISGCKKGNTKADNFWMQWKIIESLRDLGKRSIPHIGFWTGVHNRCLYIPRIDKENVRVFIEHHGITRYIWGFEGNYCLYEKNEVLHKCDIFKVIGIDEEMMLYSRIAGKKQRLSKQLNGIKQNHKRSKHLRKTIVGLQNKISDYEKLSNELFDS